MSNSDIKEPQKPDSAYGLFFRDTQAAIKSENPNVTFDEVSSVVSSMWASLSTEGKKFYKVKTEKAKDKYIKLLAVYRANVSMKKNKNQEVNISPLDTFNKKQTNEKKTKDFPPVIDAGGDEFPSTLNKENNEKAADTETPVVVLKNVDKNSDNKESDRPQQGTCLSEPTDFLVNVQSPNPSSPDHIDKNSAFMKTSNVFDILNNDAFSSFTDKGVVGIADTKHTSNLQSKFDDRVKPSDDGRTVQDLQDNDSPKVSNKKLDISPKQFYSSKSIFQESPMRTVLAVKNNMKSGESRKSPSVLASDKCLRDGCFNPATYNPRWNSDYCSNECVVSHCRNIFESFLTMRNLPMSTS